MTREQKIKSLSDFAIAQATKSQEIIDSIRTHHGKLTGDRVTLLANMMMHQQKMETLILTFVKVLSRNLEDTADIKRVVELAMLTESATSTLDRGHEMPIATFHLLFSEEERDALKPFMEQIRGNIVEITKNILAATEPK